MANLRIGQINCEVLGRWCVIDEIKANSAQRFGFGAVTELGNSQDAKLDQSPVSC